MPALAHSGTITDSAEAADSRHIRLGEVLEFRRAHIPPSVRVGVEPEPRSNDHCLFLRQGDIQPFHPARADHWVSYKDIEDAFSEARANSSRSHNAPYSRDQVFAAVKVVLAERPNPIRALLAWEPVYPARGILGVLRPGQRLWLGYAAVGVLNSPFGQALYDLELRARGRTTRKDGLDKEALNAIPIALLSYEEDALHQVASLTCQIAALYEARRECVARFTRQIEDSRERLNQALPRLLGISERGAHALLGNKEPTSPNSSLELPYAASDFLPPLPSLPPLRLLSPEQETRLAELDERRSLQADAVERDQLRRLRYWQEVVNDSLPDELGPRQ